MNDMLFGRSCASNAGPHAPRRTPSGWACLALLAVAVPGSGYARADAPPSGHAGHALGTVSFPVSCGKQAQGEFDHSVALLHHMTYPQARKSFEAMARAHPECAMAHWGIAMTLFQPLWPTRPGPRDLQRGWDEVQKARKLAPPGKRERLFVASAEAFFVDPGSTDYWLRIRRWEQATEKLYTAFPQDPEASTFHALALLATAPSNRISRENADKAADILLRVYRQNPDHPGAMHYLVHANDVPGRERESQEIIRKYETVAPDNPHALHMPTHIYTRLGDWNGVIRGNLKAAEAALATPAGENGELVWDEFPHAIEYLVYAYLQKGADDEAAAQLKRLHETPHLQPSFKTAFHLSSTRARFALERHAWDEAAAIVAREPAGLDWDHYPWAEAIGRYAHGLGAAHLARLDEARADRTRLGELEATARTAGEELFARNIRVLGLELDATLAQATGDDKSALALMRDAAELEAATPKHAVTPGPTLPAYELLGDLLAAQGQYAEALVAYQRSMTFYPKRFNSLLGAAGVAQSAGDQPAARDLYRKLLEGSDPASTRQGLSEARAYLKPD